MRADAVAYGSRSRRDVRPTPSYPDRGHARRAGPAGGTGITEYDTALTFMTGTIHTTLMRATLMQPSTLGSTSPGRERCAAL